MRKVSKTGIIRCRFELFIACKQTARRKPQSRFSRKTTKTLEESITQQKGLLNKDSIIQMSTMASLPPQWLDKYENCQILLRQVDDIKKQISSLYVKRLNTINDNEQSYFDKQIFQKSRQATKKISQCQKQLKQIKKSDNINLQDKQVCNNLTLALAVQIQQKAREVRGQQRSYVQQRRRLQNSTKVSFLQLAVEKTLGGQIYEDDMSQMVMEQIQMQTRNKQILQLVDTINELSQIYKQLSDMVILQGTLLDRIDVNLDSAVDDVKKGKQQLGKALQHQKSPLACRMIIALITILVILGIVLIAKHARR